jgi:Pro-kumamolisin, activation domain
MPKNPKSPKTPPLPEGYRQLAGSERKPRSGARRVSAADPNETISVTICVRRRPDAPAVPDQEYWAKVPPGRRKFLTREEFTAQYGASQQDLDKVAAFAESQKLKIESRNIAQRTVVVSGTVAQMSRAFHVELGRYESGEEKYRGREGAIYLPGEIADLVEGVFGLDNRKMARRANGFTPAASITPPQVAQDYNFPPGNAPSQTIGVLEFGDPTVGTLGYVPSDVNQYFTTNKGIGPGFTTPTLKDVPVNGGSNSPGGLGDTEVLIDICVAAAVAQNAHVNVYFTTWDENGWVQVIKEALHPMQGETAPSVISISFDWAEFESFGNLSWTQAAINQVSTSFQEAAALGVTIFVASGDDGSDCQIGDGSAHVYYPASDPWITCCGGTEIGAISGSYAEVTWAPFTGGGISDQFALPAWQSGAGIPLSVNPGHRQGRGIPDIAGYSNGYSIVQGGSTQGPFPGTSETAPLYAGLIALINEELGQPVGYLNPTLYALAEDPSTTGLFRDINDGASNASGGAPGYTSGPGWDACTGLGVIDGSALLAQLQAIYTKSVTIALDRDHFSQDEIDALRTQPGGAVVTGAFFVIVDGFTPAQLGITDSSSLGAAPVVNFSPSTGLTNPAACSSLVSDDPSFGPEIQRFRFGYDVNFGSDDSAFTSFASDTEIVNLNTTFQGLSAAAQIFLIKQPDPYILQGPQTWWLSNDIRLIQVAEGGSAFGVPMGNDPFAFLTAVTSALEAGQGHAGGQSFDTNTQEDSEVITVAPQNAAHKNVYNFAIARVHYRGLASTAKSVRVFFRIFAANSTDTTFQPDTTYRRYAAYSPAYPVPAVDDFQNVLPEMGLQSGEYVTMPFFAEPRQDPAQGGAPNTLPSLQTPDPTNVKDLAPTGGPLHDTFYGCWLDINQTPMTSPGTTSLVPAMPPPGNADGPWPGITLEPVQQAFLTNEHNCIVAEIAFDPVAINSGTQPFNSDKMAQRNISWSYVANPGEEASRRVLEPFEVRPTPPKLPSGARPDELMIDWNNVPVGQKAEIYLPAVDAQAVVNKATELYGVERLTRVDAHTIGCTTGGVTYIPLPQGSGGGANFVGLMSVNLPYGIRKGQQYSLLVRQLTNASGRVTPPPPPPPPPPQVAAHRAALEINLPKVVQWRQVLGTFQVNVPVSTKELLLPREEQRLSIFRWIGEAMPHQRRWYPVFQRYLKLIGEKVGALGGDPNKILPSPTGQGIPPHPEHKGEECLSFTGKISHLIFDRFGDFEAFLLDTEDGEREFRSREQDMADLAERAWRERLRITVRAEKHAPHQPLAIIVHQPPALLVH